MFCSGNVRALTAFRSTREQHDQVTAALREINAVARTECDPQLPYTITHRLRIALQTARKPLHPVRDDSAALSILQTGVPSSKPVMLKDRFHMYTLSDKRKSVNSG